MDLRKVKKLIELLEESELAEMEITEGDNTIRLSRLSGHSTVPQQIVQSVPAPTSVPPAASPVASNPTSDVAPVAAVTGHIVESPMVGTYYDSSAPDVAPYVKIGSKVKVGDTLCIIEAMKTFNQIEADADGVVKAIHKSTGEPVEFGEPLFVIG
ncbi:MAG: acetyl-CoA carboxylase biotin carboxyl carrier protein [Acidiferrobacterales bacterium]|nr:acetyl-CoA carboxylase biotin carboxyl carrier protein [Acidiferrobacterales bacterium]